MMMTSCFASTVIFVGWLVTTTLLVLSVAATSSQAFSLESTSSLPPKKVLVTGAAGKTGRLVLQKLLQADPARFDPKALVRTEQSAVQLLHDLPQLSLQQVVVSDITDPRFCEDFPMRRHPMDAMIICTSAVPRIRKRSLAKALVQIPWRWIRRQRPWIDPRQLHFCWKYQGYPELVDYHGQLAQIRLAQDHLDISQVIMISSMGVTKEDNFLNQVGKGPDGSGHGDILKWKRRTEEYLMQSGLKYVILHPGGLVDTPGGHEEFVLGVDDELVDGVDRTRISRDDVANLCVAALDLPTTSSYSLDCITRPSHSEEKGDGVLSARQALLEFIQDSSAAAKDTTTATTTAANKTAKSAE